MYIQSGRARDALSQWARYNIESKAARKRSRDESSVVVPILIERRRDSFLYFFLRISVGCFLLSLAGARFG